jgi:hypothetical protein
MKKEIIYYTCNTHREDIEAACRKQLLKSGVPIISVSREKEIDFGDKRIVLQGARSPEMMHRQVLAGLEASEAEYVFLCESDVLYHPSHFDFTPPVDDTYFYNINVWKYWFEDGLCVWVDVMQQVSGICANRELLLANYRARNERIAKEGRFQRAWGYEPGGRKLPVGFDNNGRESYKSELPNVCIRHGETLTRSKRSPDEFRNKKYAEGFRTSESIPGWGYIRDFITGNFKD